MHYFFSERWRFFTLNYFLHYYFSAKLLIISLSRKEQKYFSVCQIFWVYTMGGTSEL